MVWTEMVIIGYNEDVHLASDVAGNSNMVMTGVIVTTLVNCELHIRKFENVRIFNFLLF